MLKHEFNSSVNLQKTKLFYGYFFLNANRVYGAEHDSAYQFDFGKKIQELKTLMVIYF